MNKTIIIAILVILLGIICLYSLLFLMKHIGHYFKWDIKYSEVKKSRKKIKSSKTILWVCGYEDLHPRDAKVKYTSEVGLQCFIRIVEDGIIFHPNTSASYGLKKDNIDKIIIQKLSSGRGTWIFNYRITIYSHDSIKDNANIVTGKRIIKGLEAFADNKLQIK